MTTPSSGDNLGSSSCTNGTHPQEKEEPLLVKVRSKSKMSLTLVSYYLVLTIENICFLCVVVHMIVDTSTREITT